MISFSSIFNVFHSFKSYFSTYCNAIAPLEISKIFLWAILHFCFIPYQFNIVYFNSSSLSRRPFHLLPKQFYFHEKQSAFTLPLNLCFFLAILFLTIFLTPYTMYCIFSLFLKKQSFPHTIFLIHRLFHFIIPSSILFHIFH